jgi:hypothetical protein
VPDAEAILARLDAIMRELADAEVAAQRLTMKRVQAIVCTPGDDLADAPMRLHGVLQPRRHVGTLSGEGSASSASTRYKFARTYGEIW